MTMSETDNDDAMIDALLGDVAKVAPDVDDALMARVLADAARAPSLPGPAPARGVRAQLGELIGGWPTLGGLALAGCAGLWIGVAPPASVEDAAAGLFGTTETVSIWDDATLFGEEGLIDG